MSMALTAPLSLSKPRPGKLSASLLSICHFRIIKNMKDWHLFQQGCSMLILSAINLKPVYSRLNIKFKSTVMYRFSGLLVHRCKKGLLENIESSNRNLRTLKKRADIFTVWLCCSSDCIRLLFYE